MSRNKGLNLRMACNKLRIDPNDGSPVLEYRIGDGWVERRTLVTPAPESVAAGVQWQRLTPDQLAGHIIANTVVAHWLGHRLGVRTLLSSLGPHFQSAGDERPETPSREGVLAGLSSLEAITAI